MKRTLSILLTIIMLAGIMAIGITTVSAAEYQLGGWAFNYTFKQLDYIENTGGQYINTGYEAGPNVTVTIDLEITKWNKNYGAIFGSRTKNHAANSFIMCQSKNKKNELRTEIGTEHYTTLPVETNTRTTLTLSGNSSFSEKGLEIYLFGVNQGGSLETEDWGSATYRLYSCKITDGGKVVRNLVPVQKLDPDGAVGLVDLQNGKFYPSLGDKAFEYTKDHEHSYDLENPLSMTPPSCEQDGTGTYRCVGCEYIDEIKIPATGHHFGRDAKCIDCGTEFAEKNYQPPKRSSYSDFLSFPGAIKIVFLASNLECDVNLYDSKGNLTTYKQTEKSYVEIDGEYLKMETTHWYDKAPYYLKAIVPIYNLNDVKVIEPTCGTDGYTSIPYNNKEYKFDQKDSLGHKFNKNGVCTVCGKSFGDLSYKNEGDSSFGKAAYFEGADKIAVTFRTIGYTTKSSLHSFYPTLTDGKGQTKELSMIINDFTPYTEIVDGDSVRLSGDVPLCEFFPLYEDTKKLIKGSCTTDERIEYTYAGKTWFKVTTPAPGHKFSSTLTAFTKPTCDSEGSVTLSCENCDFSYTITVPKAHHYTKDNICKDKDCRTQFNKKLSGVPGSAHMFSFDGAQSITLRLESTQNLGEGMPVYFYDKDGNEQAALWEAFTPYVISGDTVLICFPDRDDVPENEYGYTVEVLSVDYGGNTGSVLSDGNIWIIAIVAVLALGGVAALVIVKKKNKPVAANGASTDNEE